MKRIQLSLLLLLTTTLSFAQDSFRTVKLPNGKGKLIRAVLTFKDDDKVVQITPIKGNAVSIPYGAIDHWAYEYSNERTVVLTEGKNHWLEVDYNEDGARRKLVIQLQKHDYIRILDAVKAHTGADVDLEGNVNKR